ncbi:MAG: 4Fe-4S dicluster domain-containing protein, partial [Nitrospinota bacterium]|nr:4Fe-4S dicluster domain-containing protein [Nitrospinota bacterium]
ILTGGWGRRREATRNPSAADAGIMPGLIGGETLADEMDRKDFLKKGWMGLLAPFFQEVDKENDWLPPGDALAPGRLMRPPGAIPEPDFLSTCHQCGTCIEACPADAIRFAKDGEDLPVKTPVIVAAESPCVVCESLACMSKCPSGALLSVPRESIEMGLAQVDIGTCLAWNGDDEECRVCFDMCPFKGTAITFHESAAGGLNGPVVHDEACTGCGVCEYYCPEGRIAITVEPSPRAV